MSINDDSALIAVQLKLRALGRRQLDVPAWAMRDARLDGWPQVVIGVLRERQNIRSCVMTMTELCERLVVVPGSSTAQLIVDALRLCERLGVLISIPNGWVIEPSRCPPRTPEDPFAECSNEALLEWAESLPEPDRSRVTADLQRIIEMLEQEQKERAA